MNTVGPQQPWRTPLALAIGIHLLVLLPALLAPSLSFFQRQRPPLDIQTVSLLNVAELAPATPAPQQPTPAPQPESPPPPQSPAPIPAAATPPVPVPAAPAPPADPRTIAPSEPAKVAVTRPAPAAPSPPLSTRPARTSQDEQRLQQLRESFRLEARARDAEREAELARQQALDARIAAIQAQAPAPRASQPPATTAPAPAAAGTRGGDAAVDAATREYLIRLTSHIQAHWSLPNLPTWDKDLLAVIVITVRRDGSLRDSEFEMRAENMYFNQIVQKTIQDAAPMPPFPAALRQNEMEIGLRFRPGEVF
ncbi:TonB C-terminal domain-containing protein [Desulfurivibrio sp. C05AmB]|uniref:TonB C-terminal domain-containing protein n=1 Tax=Desulfurivibrio sp. C05AmB TaxID=3374371 RepID=UPI00376F052B